MRICGQNSNQVIKLLSTKATAFVCYANLLVFIQKYTCILGIFHQPNVAMLLFVCMCHECIVTKRLELRPRGFHCSALFRRGL